MDTWETLFAKIRAAPLTSEFWYQILEQTDNSRIEIVLAVAETLLPLGQIATGAADELGLGLKFRTHNTLGWLLQALERFPGRGWRLIATGLQSPVVRNRNMALRALTAWPENAWPEEAIPLLEKASMTEPQKKFGSA